MINLIVLSEIMHINRQHVGELRMVIEITRCIQIRIGVRRRVANGHVITEAIEEHNDRLREVHDRDKAARAELSLAFRQAQLQFVIKGGRDEVERIQNNRRSTIAQAQKSYESVVAEWGKLGKV